MDAFSLIQRFFTQMQCPHCGAHLEEQDIHLLREDGDVYLVHVDCHHCHSEIGNAMVGMETSMSSMLRSHSDGEHHAVMIELDDSEAEIIEIPEEMLGGEPDEVARLMERLKQAQHPPRFAGAVGLGSLRRRYVDPELTARDKERFSSLDPIGYDDVLKAHDFFGNLGRNWQSLIPEEMKTT